MRNPVLPIAVVILLAPLFAAGAKTPNPSSAPPLHLTVILHNEEPLGGRPDYTADRQYYLQNRALVRRLVETIAAHGAAFNFQSDWNWLKAVAQFDTGDVTSDTGGKNIVRWMREDKGVEVDPHAHESQYNYADVASLIEALGVTPSRNVGGFLFDPPDNPQGWEQHETGVSGRVYPSYFWRADNLWGAATYLHQGNDDRSSGVWRPRDRDRFYEDDPGRRLLYIGGGCGDQKEVLDLLDEIGSGALPSDGFYTAKVMMIQDWMTAESIDALGVFIASLAPQVASGRVRWANLTEIAGLWRSQHGSIPFRHDCRASSPAVFSTETVETWVTAPDGSRQYTRILQPVPSQYPGQRFPALILVPGGTGNGAPMADGPVYQELAATGFVVVSFNLPGRGSGRPGDLKSEGVENCNGFLDQDGLKAVVESVAAEGNVDAANLGVLTSSFGIAVGAGALGRYPDLPAAYLIDLEGPHDSRVICFTDAGKEKAVCGHSSLATDPSPENEAFWREREAVRWIGSYPGRYLRVQAELDHAQNPHYFRHAIEMVNAATATAHGGSGQCLWTRMNGDDLGNPVNAVYALDDPAEYPVWLTGHVHPDHAGIEMEYAREMAALVSGGVPSCSIASPSEGAALACAAVIEVSAQAASGIARVEIFLDGSLLGTLESAPLQLDWDTRLAANGAHAIEAMAYDTAGRTARSPSVGVTVLNPVAASCAYKSQSKAIEVRGEGFATGCTVLVDGTPRKTVFKDAGRLVAKGATWKRGQTIRVAVSNPGGCASLERRFTR